MDALDRRVDSPVMIGDEVHTAALQGEGTDSEPREGSRRGHGRRGERSRRVRTLLPGGEHGRPGLSLALARGEMTRVYYQST